MLCQDNPLLCHSFLRNKLHLRFHSDLFLMPKGGTVSAKDEEIARALQGDVGKYHKS